MNPLKAVCLAFLSLLLCPGASAQSRTATIFITHASVLPVMPGDLSVWRTIPDALALTAQTIPPNAGLSSRLQVRITGENGFSCANMANPSSTPPFDTKTFTPPQLLAGLSHCSKLPEGRYSICFQFFNESGEAVSASACREFSVAERPKTDYTAPIPLSPLDNTQFVHEEAKRPVRFEWSGVSPRPNGQTTYLLRIWAVKDDGKSPQASAPLLTRNVTNATWLTLEDGLPGSCRPGQVCRYVWNVQALDATGNPVGSNKGYSQSFALTVADYIIRIKGITVACTAVPGVYSFTYQVQNLNPGTAKLTALAVTSSSPSGASITSFTPPLNTNIAAGGTLTLSGTISASPTLNVICIGAEITDLANSFWKASRDTCIPVPACKCGFCEKGVRFEINPTNNITIGSSNSWTYVQPIAITTTPSKLVKNVEAQLIYFEYLPENANCPACDTHPEDMGNMSAGSLAGAWASGTGTHSLDWVFSPAINFTTPQNASITITIPPTAGCCVTLRWCVRYVITFNDCTVCSKVVCYEKKKVGCSNGDPDHNHN